MTQEEKQLLLADLCARLPYDIQVQINIPYVNIDFDKDHDYITNSQNNCILTLSNISEIQKMTDDIKPYLRPISSMTEEEKTEISKLLNYEFYVDSDCALVAEDDRHRIRIDLMQKYIDWLNAHHFDYRGLIEKGLALEAPEGMYK